MEATDRRTDDTAERACPPRRVHTTYDTKEK